MDVVPSFVANAEASKLMKPPVGAFNHPTINAEAAAVFRVAFGQERFDAQAPQLIAVSLGIVRAIGIHALGPATRTPNLARDRGNRFDHRQQLADIGRVGAGHRGCQGNPVSVGGEMVFRTCFPAIRWIGPRFFPPCTARTEDESTTARDQSIWLACWRWARSAVWTFFQMPFFCQADKRRQQLMPLPQPSSCGSNSQGIPVRSTNRIPLSAGRCPIGLRPGYRRRRFFGAGKSGSINAHSVSSKIGLAMLASPCATTTIPNFTKST